MLRACITTITEITAFIINHHVLSFLFHNAFCVNDIPFTASHAARLKNRIFDDLGV